MTMITPSYLGETIEYSSLHACRSTLEDPTAARLLEQGLAPDTPALVGEALGHADERLIRTTIAELAQDIGQDSAEAKATVILFGALGRGVP